ncbi:MAG: DUF4153 domain-containing protein, partial [Gemmatimonadales bacterium]
MALRASRLLADRIDLGQAAEERLDGSRPVGLRQVTKDRAHLASVFEGDLALVPSIVMLLLAIWKRIDQYGITERRYFLAVLALWLAGIAIFYVVSRSRNILVIPLTLCIVAVATFGGPWSAYSVSEASQVRRLTGLLASNEMLEGGRARAAEREVSFEDRREVSAILRYLTQTHGT